MHRYGYYEETKRRRWETRTQATGVPPQFTQPIQNQHVNEGQSAKFTVRVSGQPAPEVSWYREGAKIVSSHDFEISQAGDVHTLLIPEVFVEDAGQFTVKAENQDGQVSASAKLNVQAVSPMEDSAPSEPELAPAFHPPPRTPFTRPLRDSRVHEGERVVLECWINPYPEPQRVEWYKNQVLIRPTHDYRPAYNNGVCTLTIAEVFPEDSGRFTCTVSINGINSSTSMILTVEALPPQAPQQAPLPMEPERAPVFERELSNQPLYTGQTAYFECHVSANPAPEILWTRKGHPLVDKARYQSTYDQYTGVTTLTIKDLKQEDEGEYTCTAINSCGEASTSATLMSPDRYQSWLQGPVQAPVQPEPVQPAYYQPPKEPTHRPDEDFKVSSFEQRLQAEIEFRDGHLHPQHRVADEEAYDDSIPSDQAAKPRFDQTLKDFKLMEGSDTTFVCKVAGHPRPHIIWYHNGRLIRPSKRYEMKLTRDGYATLRIRVAFPEDAGHYTCCATNIVGRATCSAELYIEGLGNIDETSYVSPESLRRLTAGPSGPKGPSEPGGVSEKFYRPVFRKVPSDMEVPEGKTCRLDCMCTGRPFPDVLWFRENDQVHDDNNHKVVVNEDGIHSLIIHSTQKSDAGRYTCIARNRGGEDRFQVNLNVTPRQEAQIPRFTERLQNAIVQEGQPVEFVAIATGYPTPMMSWQKDNRHVDHDPHYQVTRDGSSSRLRIDQTTPKDSAWFQCTAANIAGTATNRAKLTVQPTPRQPREERKLYIPKRTTPTPTKEMVSQKVPQPKRPHSVEPPKTARAEIILSPTPPPAKVVAPGPPLESVIQPTDQAQAFKPYEPKDSDLLKYIQEQEKDKKKKPVSEPMDTADAADIEFKPPPAPRPSTKELIDQGIEPQPDQGDMFDRENPKPPKFKTHIRPQIKLRENDPAFFECRLIPIGDPDMVVEWYKDGQPLAYGSRFRTTYDFGYVSLEILWTLPEDNGLYVCHAHNKHGEDVTQAKLHCTPKESVIYDTQLPDDTGVQRLARMEEQIRRDRLGKQRMEEGPEPSPPVFDLMPEAVQAEEGDTAKFLCRVGGHPRPRLTWWINGTILVNGHRFRLGYDGMMNFLEIPKVREYDAGTVRVMAKNPLGEAECSTTLVVLPREDWRLRLKHAPKSTVQVELGKHKTPELRSQELDSALKKPRTTVTELRAFERSAQEKALTYRDDEVKQAFYDINLQHAQMQRTDSDARGYEPHMRIGTDVHIDRAKHMLGMEQKINRDDLSAGVGRSARQHEPPTFTKPLMNVKTKEGHIVKMEVGFSGFPYPDIQWFREGVEIQSSNDFRITTLNNKSFLLIKEAFLEDAGLFTVRASNQFGMAECKGMLTVQEDPNKVRDIAPEFTVQMRDLTIKLGEPATFDVEIIGHPRPEVYWTKNGQRLTQSPRWKFIIEDNHFTLLIYETRVEDQGTYECVVVNKLGKTTCTSALNVVGRPEPPKAAPKPAGQQVVAPRLVEPLKDQHVNEGEGATFQCTIVATPAPAIHWYHNNTLIKPSKYFHMQSRDNTHNLHIAGAFPEDEGIYKCTARNQEGEVTCIAHLKVFALSSEPEPEAYGQMVPPQFLKSITASEVKAGEQAHFVAEFAGQPLPEVTWYREGIQILHSDEFQIIQDGNKCVLFIKEVFPEDSGVFTCRAINPAGVSECSAQLYVQDLQQVSTAKLQFQGPPKAKPQILKAPSPQREMHAGNTAKLMVHLASNPPPKFAWFYNGRQIQQSQRFKVTYEEEIVTLFIYNVQPSDSGEYMLRAANDLGEVTCRTVLNIKPTQKTVEVPMQSTRQVTLQSTQREQVPVFSRPLPPEIRVRERTIAKLETFIDAYPTPIITWHVNGSQIRPSPKYTVKHEGNKAILLVKNVTVEDSGTYTCKARSDLGEAVTSTTVYVTGSQPRTEPPRFLLPLKNAQAMDGQQVALRCRVQGIPIPEINWFLNDKPIDKNEDYLINYDRSTGNIELLIADCLLEDSGVFKCVARNTAGQDVTQCTLQVHAPEDQQQPTQVQRVHAQPKAKAVVQKGDREVVKQVAESELDRTLHHKDVKVVKKIVKKQSGQPPKFTKPIQPQVVKEGEDANFIAVVSGAPQPDIIWLKDKVQIQPSNKYQMSMDASGTCTLRILFSQPGDVGVYSCRAENPAGKATCTANVVVVHPDEKFATTPGLHMVPPSFKVGLKTQQSDVGQNIVLPFHVEGKPMPTLVVYHNNGKVKLGHRMELKFGRQSGAWELHLSTVIPHDSGMIRITATNPVGEASTEAKLMVTGALAFAVRDSHKIQYVVEEPAKPQEKKPYVPVFSEPPVVYETFESTANEYSSEKGNLEQRPTKDSKYKPQFEVTEDSVTDTRIRREHEVAREDRHGNKTYDKNVLEQESKLEEHVEPHLYVEGEEGAGEAEDPLALHLHQEEQAISLERFPGDPSVQKFSKTTQERIQGQDKEKVQPMRVVQQKGVSQDGMLEVTQTQGQGSSEKQSQNYVKSTKTDVQIRDASYTEVVDLSPTQPQILPPEQPQPKKQDQRRRQGRQQKPPTRIFGEPRPGQAPAETPQAQQQVQVTMQQMGQAPAQQAPPQQAPPPPAPAQQAPAPQAPAQQAPVQQAPVQQAPALEAAKPAQPSQPEPSEPSAPVVEEEVIQPKVTEKVAVPPPPMPQISTDTTDDLPPIPEQEAPAEEPEVPGDVVTEDHVIPISKEDIITDISFVPVQEKIEEMKKHVQLQGASAEGFVMTVAGIEPTGDNAKGFVTTVAGIEPIAPGSLPTAAGTRPNVAESVTFKPKSLENVTGFVTTVAGIEPGSTQVHGAQQQVLVTQDVAFEARSLENVSGHVTTVAGINPKVVIQVNTAAQDVTFKSQSLENVQEYTTTVAGIALHDQSATLINDVGFAEASVNLSPPQGLDSMAEITMTVAGIEVPGTKQADAAAESTVAVTIAPPSSLQNVQGSTMVVAGIAPQAVDNGPGLGHITTVAGIPPPAPSK